MTGTKAGNGASLVQRHAPEDLVDAEATAAAEAIVDHLATRAGAPTPASIPAAMQTAAREVADRLPAAAHALGEAATTSTDALVALPERNARLLAAFSAGLGVGLCLAGAPRLVVVTASVPAIVGIATARPERDRRPSPG